MADYQHLRQQAEQIYDAMPAEKKDAFFQLVLHPVKACAVLNELYFTVGKNRMYAVQGRAATNDLAERARACFAKTNNCLATTTRRWRAANGIT